MGLLSDAERGPFKGEIERFARRDPFSPYLAYRAYDETEQAYHNTDNTIGYVWECKPAAFLGNSAADTLAALLRQAFPAETVLSVSLFPDDDIDPILERYLKLKTAGGSLARRAAEQYATHLSGCREGTPSMSGIRVKNFRVILSIKAPGGLSRELKAQVVESLSSAGLAPTPMKPHALLQFLRTALNDRRPSNPALYNPDVFLGKQIVLADSPIRNDQENMLLWFGR
jgi:conjugal transfer ATP-binding protein TraC